jgi:hypothetical protein
VVEQLLQVSMLQGIGGAGGAVNNFSINGTPTARAGGGVEQVDILVVIVEEQEELEEEELVELFTLRWQLQELLIQVVVVVEVVVMDQVLYLLVQ